MCVCWRSLVRRHIKAIYLIDEAYYNWRVGSSSHSSSFFFFSWCASPSFSIIPLLSQSLPTGPSRHLNWRAAVVPQNLLPSCWGTTNSTGKLCFSKPWWNLLLWDNPKRLKCTLFQSGWDVASSLSLEAENKAQKLNQRQRESGLQGILAPGGTKAAQKSCCAVYRNYSRDIEGKARQHFCLSSRKEQKDKETKSLNSPLSVIVLTAPRNNSTGKTVVGYCLRWESAQVTQFSLLHRQSLLAVISLLTACKCQVCLL